MGKRRTAVVALVAVVLAGGLWAYVWFGTATIAVTSQPEGAVVRVDGRQRGITPLSRLELPTGRHKLEVAHSHYATYTEGLDLSRGDHLQRDIVLQVGEGTFEFLSNPKAAWVEVDGQRLDGVTPLSFSTLSGEYEIAMGQQERRIVNQTHTLKAGETLEVNFNLNIDPHGSFTLSTTPRGSKIEFLDSTLQYAPNMRIPIGEYPIRVSKAGYVTQEFRHTIQYGDNKHHVSLQRAYGRLKVDVVPSHARVDLRYPSERSRERQSFKPGTNYPVGPLQVRARAEGYRTQVKNIELQPEGASLRFNLSPMAVVVGEVITDTLSSGGRGPEMVVVPAGTFTMGDPAGPPSEQPAHTVALTQPFAVSKYEIRIGDYAKYAPVPDRLADLPEDHPIAYVSFDAAQAYADWLSEQTGESYRLPSEAEWEYFAKAGASGAYFFGTNIEGVCGYANVADLTAKQKYGWDVIECEDGMIRPGPVGSFAPNPFGLYDIIGNVSEWVSDCGMPSYAGSPADGSPRIEGTGCSTRGFRGGSWDSGADEIKSTYRNTGSRPSDDRGIRLVREL